MSRHNEVRQFLSEYVPAEFAARVLERFAEQDESLDASYAWASLRAFQTKLSAEISDVAAFAAIISTRTADDDRARALLAAIAQRAAKADQLAGELQRLLASEQAA